MDEIWIPFAAFVVMIVLQIVTIARQEKFMSSASQALTDLQNVASALAAALAKLQTDVNTGIAELQQALQNQNGVDPAAIEAVVTGLQGSVATAGAIDTSVVNAEQQAPTPAPPAPTPGS